MTPTGRQGRSDQRCMDQQEGRSVRIHVADGGAGRGRFPGGVLGQDRAHEELFAGAGIVGTRDGVGQRLLPPCGSGLSVGTTRRRQRRCSCPPPGKAHKAGKVPTGGVTPPGIDAVGINSVLFRMVQDPLHCGKRIMKLRRKLCLALSR